MKRLFSIGHSSFMLHLTLLFLRVSFGMLMIPAYGYAKWSSYAEKKDEFFDLMGLGGAVSMGLTIFAELVCSILLILGLFTRLATIPLLITMLVVIDLHDWQLFDRQELAPAFFAGYLTILLLGPGKYGLDAWVTSRLA